MRFFRSLAGSVVALGFVVALGLLDPARAAADRLYTVRAGDSIARIAARVRVAAHDLASANGLRADARIRPGQVLTVPDRGVVYVRAGQTLSHVAAAHHCSITALARANRLRPGATLRVGQRLQLPGFVAATPQDWGEPAEVGVVSVRRRDVAMRFRLLDDQGRVSRRGLGHLGQLMARHPEDPAEGEDGQREEALEEGEDAEDIEAAAALVRAEAGEAPVVASRARGVPEPRLAALLAKISDHFGGRRITIVSGFREPRGFTRETSQHVAGHATDIRVEGVPNRVLWDYCRSLANTGCGYYPNSSFVHVDVRERHAQWVDWSRPGGRPRYGSLSGPGRRRMLRDPVRRQITRPEEVPLVVEIVDGRDDEAFEQAQGAEPAEEASPTGGDDVASRPSAPSPAG